MTTITESDTLNLIFYLNGSDYYAIIDKNTCVCYAIGHNLKALLRDFHFKNNVYDLDYDPLCIAMIDPKDYRGILHGFINKVTGYRILIDIKEEDWFIMEHNQIGIYRCEYCHAEFMSLDEKWRHIKKFHGKNPKTFCNFAKNFRQSVIWEYEKV